MKLLTLFSTAIIATSALYSCSRTDVRIEDHQDILHDHAFDAEAHHASKHATIYRDFETKYAVTVTHFSASFTSAFRKRSEAIFLQQATLLDKYKDHNLFFVSIFVPTAKQFDLKDTSSWTVKLRTNNGEHAPVLIDYLDQKDYWQSFFPYISSWSKEYVVGFPRESTSYPLDLVIANIDAKVIMNWPGAN